jgi:hypothetical protein
VVDLLKIPMAEFDELRYRMLQFDILTKQNCLHCAFL